MFVSQLSSFRYVEASEGYVETAFQALEVANVVAIFEKTSNREPKAPVTLQKDVTLLSKGVSPSGCEKLWDMAMKKDKYGLGYKLFMGKNNAAKSPIGKIEENFCKGGFASQDQIAAIGDAPEDEEMPCLVYRRSTSASLGNWTAVEIPKIVSFTK